MRRAGLLPVAAILGCEDRTLDADRFAQAAWDDGEAVVSVFEGRRKQHGALT